MPASISRRIRLASALLGAALLLPAIAQAQDARWSELTGERHGRPSTNRDPATLRMIDGVTVLDRTKVRVRPGMHSVLVRRIPKHGMHTSDRTLRVDTKPCKRYYINAQFSSPGSSLWQPVVDKVEDIPGCALPVETPEVETPAPTIPPAKGTSGVGVPRKPY